MKKLISLLCVAVFAFAQTAYGDVNEEMMMEKSMPGGVYVGMEAGLSLSTSPKFASRNNGIPSRCDLHYAGLPGFVADLPEYNADSGCTGFGGSGFESGFKSSIGHTVGAVVGYSRVADLPVRVEVEYFYRNNEFDDRATTGLGGEKGKEFHTGFGGGEFSELGDIQSHNFFANLYYDINIGSKFVPYLGAGVGVAATKADLYHFFHRNNSDDIGTGTGHPAGHAGADCVPTDINDCVLEDLEGTVSSSSRTLNDTVYGFQTIIGFDYPLSDKITAGLKLRWVYFGKFKDNQTWDVLRGHESTVAPETIDNLDMLGRDNRITYSSETKDTQFWGAALSLKYYLN